MPVQDSNILFHSSMFSSIRYQSNDIPYTFNYCQCWSISTPITALSITFAARINIFNCWNNSIVVSDFSVKRAEIDHNGAYFIQIYLVFDSTPAFYKALLSTNIISASDLNWFPSLREKKILLSCCSDCFRLFWLVFLVFLANLNPRLSCYLYRLRCCNCHITVLFFLYWVRKPWCGGCFSQVLSWNHWCTWACNWYFWYVLEWALVCRIFLGFQTCYLIFRRWKLYFKLM